MDDCVVMGSELSGGVRGYQNRECSGSTSAKQPARKQFCSKRDLLFKSCLAQNFWG